MTLEQSKKYHQVARALWRRDQFRLPPCDRVDAMGDCGLMVVLDYQRRAKAILEATGWEIPAVLPEEG